MSNPCKTFHKSPWYPIHPRVSMNSYQLIFIKIFKFKSKIENVISFKADSTRIDSNPIQFSRLRIDVDSASDHIKFNLIMYIQVSSNHWGCAQLNSKQQLTNNCLLQLQTPKHFLVWVKRREENLNWHSHLNECITNT